MKKFFKVFSSICLVMVVSFAVLFAGCAKKYTVNVQATDGGVVLKRAIQSKSMIGNHEVEEGQDFEIAIRADDGFCITKVTVNGKAQDMSSWDRNTEGDLVSHTLVVKNITQNTKIIVTFGNRQGTLTFKFADDSSVAFSIPQYKTFTLPTSTFFYTNSAKTDNYKVTIYNLKTKSAYLFVDNSADVSATTTALEQVFTEDLGCIKL